MTDELGGYPGRFCVHAAPYLAHKRPPRKHSCPRMLSQISLDSDAIRKKHHLAMCLVFYVCF